VSWFDFLMLASVGAIVGTGMAGLLWLAHRWLY